MYARKERSRHMKYIFTVPQNYEELVDVANRIFTTREDGSYDNTYFQRLVPNLYGSADVLLPHLLAYDGDKLVGHVAVQKSTLRMGQESLNLVGIGTVGVLREYRGKGIMQEMFGRVHEELHASGADLSELAGKRRRYAYFGYTTGCAGVDIRISRSEFDADNSAPYRFEEFRELSTDDLELFMQLHSAEAVYTQRSPEHFALTLQAWRRKALRILKDEQCIGYCTANSEGDSLYELEIAPTQDPMAVIGAYLYRFGQDGVNLRNFSPLWFRRYPVLARVATSFNLIAQERYHIFRYDRVIQAGLSAKAQVQALCHGTLTLAIENFGTLTIQVGDRVCVERSNVRPDLELTEEDAVHLLLGIVPGAGAYPLPDFAAGWFPLPVHTLTNDRI